MGAEIREPWQKPPPGTAMRLLCVPAGEDLRIWGQKVTLNVTELGSQSVAPLRWGRASVKGLEKQMVAS